MANPDVIIATTPESIRLDCLRLAHRHDLDPERVVERAEVFAKYVNGSTTPSRSATPGRGTKKDNPLS